MWILPAFFPCNGAVRWGGGKDVCSLMRHGRTPEMVVRQLSDKF